MVTVRIGYNTKEGENMSDAQEKDSVMQHFVDGKLTRLNLTMLPRDTNRSLGSARSALVSSFNYVKQYPAKLELFIDVMKFITNYAMAYQHHDKIRREKAAAVNAKVKKDKAEIAEAQAGIVVKDQTVAKVENGKAYNAAGEELISEVG